MWLLAPVLGCLAVVLLLYVGMIGLTGFGFSRIPMESQQELSQRIDAAMLSMREKHRQFQEFETRKYLEWKQRMEKLHASFESLTGVIKTRSDVLIRRFGDNHLAGQFRRKSGVRHS